MTSSRLENGIEKYWDKNVNEVKDFDSYGKRYKIILSTKADDDKYKYLNIY